MLAALGSRSLGGTPEDLARRMRAEIAFWKPIITEAKITLE
jgi:hypothetical protein